MQKPIKISIEGRVFGDWQVVSFHLCSKSAARVWSLSVMLTGYEAWDRRELARALPRLRAGWRRN